jgi:hypothetical protein
MTAYFIKNRNELIDSLTQNHINEPSSLNIPIERLDGVANTIGSNYLKVKLDTAYSDFYDFRAWSEHGCAYYISKTGSYNVILSFQNGISDDEQYRIVKSLLFI